MSFTGVFVFGDSLVDGGSALKLAEEYANLPLTKMPEQAPVAERGYLEGRFSDGYTFADLIANKAIGSVSKPVFPFGFDAPWLGLPISPFRPDPTGNNLNFAYGGARVRQGSEVVPDLDDQTDAFRDAVDGRADPDALYMITIGGNDVRGIAPAERKPVARKEAYSRLEKAADKMLIELSQLVELGAEHLLLTGIPDVGAIPKYDLDANRILDSLEQGRASTATNYSGYLDTLIRSEVAPALRSKGATVTYVPISSYVSESGEQVVGALDAVLPTLAALHGLAPEELRGNPLQFQQLIYFDQVHPTGQVHALVGSYIYAQLTGTPWVETLPLGTANISFDSGGSIAVAGEIDTLIFALAPGTTYTFELLGISSLGTAGALGDPSLRLLDLAGTTVLAADADSGAGFDARLSFTTGASGTYSLSLSAEGSLTGNYLLQAAIDGAAKVTGNRYVVDSATTLVIEPRGGVGVDVVATSVSYSLPPGSEIEVLRTARNGSAPINLTGNEFGQEVVGNFGPNVLDGKGGNDMLWGRGGRDVFLFSSDLDGSIDTLMDFNARFDTIALHHAVFGGSPGALPLEWFTVGSAASLPDHRIVFDLNTRALYYDADGSGPAGPTHFATLAGAYPIPDATDFVIV
jgi:Ca2+-binding RTX toxin-like protein